MMGKITDKRNEYTLIISGLVGVALVMAGLAIFPQYGFKLIASFLLGVLLELFSIIQKSLVTVLGPSESYGKRGSAFESIATLGDLW
jgi:predicted MFS family arabinose efflux permease